MLKTSFPKSKKNSLREIFDGKRTQQIFRSQNTAKQAVDGREKLSTRVFFVSILFYPEPCSFNEILNLEGKVNGDGEFCLGEFGLDFGHILGQIIVFMVLVKKIRPTC